MKQHARRRVRGVGRREDPIADAAVKVPMRVARRTAAVAEHHRAQAGCRQCSRDCARAGSARRRAARGARPRRAAAQRRAENSAAAWARQGPIAAAATAATRERAAAPPSPPCAGWCTTGRRPGLGTSKQPGSRARTPRNKPGPNHNCGLRIRGSGATLVRHRPALPSRPTRPRAPAKSRTGSGQCATTTCVRDGGADNTGCRRAPLGLRQTSEHPSKRVDTMGEGKGVAQPAAPGALWRPLPPEPAGFTAGTRSRDRPVRIAPHDGCCAPAQHAS